MKRNFSAGIISFMVIMAFLSCSDNFAGKEVPGAQNSAENQQEGIIPYTDDMNSAFPPGFIPESVDKTSDNPADFGKAYPTSQSINVPRYAQETGYWCGPASAQMVQYYFSQPASQTTIANYCGTTSSIGTYVYKLVDWFNSAPMTGYMYLPSWWQWEYYYLQSYTDFKNKVQWSVAGYSAPQVWHLVTYPSSTYHLPGYTFNSGHYVTGSGYNLSGSETVLYDDPWYGSGGGADIWIAAYTMYYCIISNARYIIY